MGYLATILTLSVLAIPQGWNKYFCATGLVVQSSPSSLLLRCEREKNLFVSMEECQQTNSPPQTGEIIEIYCHKRRTQYLEPSFFGLRFRILGNEKVPAPRNVQVADLDTCVESNERITLQAEVEDFFIDDVDPRFYYLVLKSGPSRIYGWIPRDEDDNALLETLIGATVRLTGIVTSCNGARIFGGNQVAIGSFANLQVIKPAETDLSRLPILNRTRLDPKSVARLPRSQIAGIVLATWKHKMILVRSSDGLSITVSLRNPARLPHVGESVIAAGYPTTDFFNLSLSGGKWQSLKAPINPDSIPITILGELFSDLHGNHTINPLYHGADVKVCGKVLRSNEQEFSLDLGQDVITVCAGDESGGFGYIKPNSKVEVCGISILVSDIWRSNMPFPRLQGVSVITRKANDIVILQRPPWWTPVRILIAFAGLVAFIVGLIVWNRILMRIATRRSRELIREQLAKERSELKTDERTRLAIELHDSLSQNLSGLGCQLVATRLVLNTDSPACARLETAERMLQSTRTELKRCLFDLREDLLEDPDFERAVRTTLGTLLGTCQLKLRIHIARSVMDDSVAHAVLSIVRELVSNAIRHGRASKVQVAGSLQYGPDPTQILVSVRDNGKGFDPQSCAGPIEGHFGLTGIRDRISRAGGAFHIESTPGRTYARFSIPV